MSHTEPVRYLCSQLVTLVYEDGETIVNLEEIQEARCVVESEEGVSEGAAVELLCGAADFRGTIKKAEAHGFGWRLTVEFSPATPWKPGDFRPEHLFDPASMKQP